MSVSGEHPMDPRLAGLRVGVPERDGAVQALGAHREAGRLTSVEYEDRSVRAGRATTWGEVAALFVDLPDPRPVPPAGAAGTGRVAAEWPAEPSRTGWDPDPTRRARRAMSRQGRGPGGRAPLPAWVAPMRAALPVLILVAVITTHSWEWFLAVPLVGALFGRGRRGGRRGGRPWR